ncbi:spinster family MFS transporter [Altericroceibacterium endophyticum]|uniref:MFS transporter n=1 Tax=Altericroceibacterium endophyticum TaxID=1808508 RepID=A0A6I4T3F0_9SPHN|nr:MFS transporter [Altericroceibacterium endophyticum]MXO65437.1 MFS transporter [Altericroceibacterium endophyticum]
MGLSTRRGSPWLALIVLTGISAVGFIDRIVLNVLAEPIKLEFGLSDTQLGLLTGLAFAVLNVGLGIFVARVAERRRRMSLIALGTVLWSLATAACGFVSSWVQLLFARIGVGVGEAVGLPATQSVVSDYFPPERRATAMSVLLLAPPIGAFIGSAGGAWIAQYYGWRSAFIAAAIPGILLAAFAYLFVSEPLRGQFDREGGDDHVPPISAVAKRFLGLGSARNMLIGSTLASLVGFGLNAFVAVLLLRKFGFSLLEAGVYSGLLASFPGAISVFFGGRLADHFGKTHPSAYALVPGICLLLSAPLYIVAISSENVAVLLSVMCVAALFQYAYLGVTYGTLHNLLHPRMRATGSALLSALYGLLGQGIGPVVIGAISDQFIARGFDGGTSIARAMAITAGLYLIAGAFYCLAARHLKGDFEKVQNM